MFLGEYEHTLDNKGRLTIPSRFRNEMAGGVVITRGLDKCLWVFTRSEFERLVEKIVSQPITNVDVRSFARYLAANAQDLTPDRQGRVLIPQKLRDYAGIDSEAVVIGAMNRVEVWNPERWRAEESKLTDDEDSFAKQLAALGI